MLRSSTATAALAVLALASPGARADVLDATYTFFRIGAEYTDACLPGTPELTILDDFGALFLHVDGTFTVLGSMHVDCMFGGTVTTLDNATGTYTLTPDGDLTLDFDPSMPGTEVDHFRASLDRELIVGKDTFASEPAFLVAVRRGAGMDVSFADGVYTAVGLGQRISQGGIEAFVGWGAVVIDGAGTLSGSLTDRYVGPTGTSLVGQVLIDSYTVSADGLFTLGSGHTGVLSSDGNFAFLMNVSGTYDELYLLLRRPSHVPSPGATDGTWYVDSYHEDWSGPGASCEPAETRGTVDIDGVSTHFLYAGTQAWAGVSGGGGGPDAGSGTLTIASDGAIVIDDGGAVTAGSLSADEELILFATLADPASPGIGLALRGAPPAFAPYCFGDGLGTPCPCGNDHDGSRALGRAGCANGSSSGGAALAALGSASVSAGDLTLAVDGLPPGQPGLVFQALNAVNGGAGLVFGDGLRCAGGTVKRLAVLVASAGGSVATWPLDLAAVGAVAPGDLRRYQYWYRDPLGSPCGNVFNLSNGVEGDVDAVNQRRGEAEARR